MASWLFGVQAYDPAVIWATVLVLLAAAFAAAAIPARRAAGIQPMLALRSG